MTKRTLDDFQGRWRLTRAIAHDTGQTARFTGLAAWQPHDGGLIYSEIGRLEIPGQPSMSAERKYVWDKDLRVYFDDGRFFHQVPETGGPTAHWCDPDQYDVVYDFSQWPGWSCVWDVRGPRKSYQMRSDYEQL